ncbi:MAG: antibiotic biosynthesis monooxygenase [Balneolales bacterium]
MIRLIAEYRIKPRTEARVLTAVKTFVAAVHRDEPQTEYRAYRLTDTNEFLHIMAFPDESAQNVHQQASYTRDLVEVLYPNCEEPPKFTLIESVEQSDA